MEAPNTPAQAMTAASETAFAPHGPTNNVAASASGRSELARFGRVPTQTTCVIVYRTKTQPTDTRIANGTERCGSRTSPANTEVASKPKKANVARKMALDKLVSGGGEPRCRDFGSTKNTPIATKAISGTSFETVNAVPPQTSALSLPHAADGCFKATISCAPLPGIGRTETDCPLGHCSGFNRADLADVRQRVITTHSCRIRMAGKGRRNRECLLEVLVYPSSIAGVLQQGGMY
jgi:hypothetical protein